MDDVRERRSGFGFVGAFVAAIVLYSATKPSAAIYPVYEQIYGISPFTVTTIYGAYAVALIPTLLITGAAAHVVGFRVMLSAAWAVGAIGMLLMAAANGLVLLHLGRFLQGVAMGLATGGMAATLLALERRNDPARASAAMTMAISFGTGIGPIVAGALAENLPSPDRLSFVVFGVLLALCSAGFLLLPRRLGTTGVRWSPRLPQIPAESRSPFLLTCAKGAGVGTAFPGGTDAVNRMSATRPDAAGVFAAFAMSCYAGSGLLIIAVGLLGNLVGTPRRCSSSPS